MGGTNPYCSGRLEPTKVAMVHFPEAQLYNHLPLKPESGHQIAPLETRQCASSRLRATHYHRAVWSDCIARSSAALPFSSFAHISTFGLFTRDRTLNVRVADVAVVGLQGGVRAPWRALRLPAYRIPFVLDLKGPVLDERAIAALGGCATDEGVKPPRD
jgi:hypothetical protein